MKAGKQGRQEGRQAHEMKLPFETLNPFYITADFFFVGLAWLGLD